MENYCQCLARGMAKTGWALESIRVAWMALRPLAFAEVLARALLVHTALAWSRNGFPLACWSCGSCGGGAHASGDADEAYPRSLADRAR